MNKIIFLLIIMCIIFTGCEKDNDTNQDLSMETTSVQTEMHSNTSAETESAEMIFDAENALQEAIIDEEERNAIEAVQETEKRIYYKTPIRNFDPEAYANLNIGPLNLRMLDSGYRL